MPEVTMPEVTVNIKMNLVKLHEAHYELRLLPIQPDNEPEGAEEEPRLPELQYVVPSRTNITPQGHHEFRPFR